MSTRITFFVLLTIFCFHGAHKCQQVNSNDDNTNNGEIDNDNNNYNDNDKLRQFSPLNPNRLRYRRSNTESECTSATSGVHVFLTINALIQSGNRKRRQLELNWVTPSDVKYDQDWIGLFKGKPTRSSNTRNLVRVNVSEHVDYFLTNEEVPSHPLLGRRSPTNSCIYGYWIAYVRNQRIMKMNCLRIRPTWMYDERDVIGDIPLSTLMLPGTHNSGAYEVDETEDSNIFDRFTVTQSEDTWNQLIYGIRYLDIRAGYNPHTPEKFWTMHDFVAMNPLFKVVQDIRKFLLATNEIVIMDFHRFPKGFENSTIHDELIAFLFAELGEFIAPDWLGWRVTPNELWRRNRTLIISYAHDPSSAFNSLIWPEVKHVWANTLKEDQLKEHLQGAMNYFRYSRYPWAAMTHLTPTELDVFLKPAQGIRSMSDSIARKLNKWYKDLWWDSANIVATDFFLGNNIIEESILANRRRQKCRQRRSSRFV